MTISPELENDRVLEIIWRNWRAEWMTLFGAVRSLLLAQDHERINLDLSTPHRVVLRRQEGVLGQVEGEDVNPATLRAILERRGISGGFDAVLRLPQGELLARRIELPFMSAAALKGALQFELERLTPLPPNRLYFDFRHELRERKANRTVIAVRLIKREAVNDAVALAHGAGAQIIAIQFDGEARDADWRNFPIDRPAFLRHLWRRFGLAACCGLVAALMLILCATIYWRGTAVTAAYDDAILSARHQAREVTLIERQIREAKAALSFPIRQKQRPLIVGTLSDLAQALPDNSWISDLEFSSGRLRLRGLSQSASDLIAALDRSGHFTHAAFSAPILRNPQDKMDHFDLTAGVVGGAT